MQSVGMYVSSWILCAFKGGMRVPVQLSLGRVLERTSVGLRLCSQRWPHSNRAPQAMRSRRTIMISGNLTDVTFVFFFLRVLRSCIAMAANMRQGPWHAINVAILSCFGGIVSLGGWGLSCFCTSRYIPDRIRRLVCIIL